MWRGLKILIISSMKATYKITWSLYCYYVHLHKILDFFTSTELIPKRRLPKWINRPGFGIRKVVILKWIVLGNILTLGYKTTLLSSLIPIQYEDTIDTISDLYKSGVPLLLAKATTTVDYVERDPRKMMADISKRTILYSLNNGRSPPWVLKMYSPILRITWTCSMEFWWKILNFRIGEGNAVSVTADEVKAILINYYHFSKDPLYSRHASYIVPKGSPLQVRWDMKMVFSAGYYKSYIH